MRSLPAWTNESPDRVERGMTRMLQNFWGPGTSPLPSAVTPTSTTRTAACLLRTPSTHDTEQPIYAMPIYNLPPYDTRIDDSAWVAPGAAVIGCVTLARNTSVWFNAVIRGDNERIEVGEDSNVQEGAVLHTDIGYPLRVGRRVSVGHQAMLHGCQIGDGSMIGIQAIVMNGAQIGKNCIVGAGAVVTEGKVFPDNVLIVGCPAKLVRELTGADAAKLQNNATDYVERAQRYKLTLEASG